MSIGKFRLITGPMFGGKTEELLRLATRYTIAGKTIILFTSKDDTRYGDGIICTHNKKGVPARKITNFEDIFPAIMNYRKPIDAVFVDELQFINNVTAKNLFTLLETHGVSLYASGLILDSFRIPFPGMKEILPYAEVTHLNAVCDLCGNFEAIYTFRFAEDSTQVLLGGKESYCALCKDCYHKKPTREKI